MCEKKSLMWLYYKFNIPVPSLDKHRRLHIYDSINHVMYKRFKGKDFKMNLF